MANDTPGQFEFEQSSVTPDCWLLAALNAFWQASRGYFNNIVCRVGGGFKVTLGGKAFTISDAAITTARSGGVVSTGSDEAAAVETALLQQGPLTSNAPDAGLKLITGVKTVPVISGVAGLNALKAGTAAVITGGVTQSGALCAMGSASGIQTDKGQPLHHAFTLVSIDGASVKYENPWNTATTLSMARSDFNAMLATKSILINYLSGYGNTEAPKAGAAKAVTKAAGAKPVVTTTTTTAFLVNKAAPGNGVTVDAPGKIAVQLTGGGIIDCSQYKNTAIATTVTTFKNGVPGKPSVKYQSTTKIKEIKVLGTVEGVETLSIKKGTGHVTAVNIEKIDFSGFSRSELQKITLTSDNNGHDFHFSLGNKLNLELHFDEQPTHTPFIQSHIDFF